MPPAGGDVHLKGGCLFKWSLGYLPISPVIYTTACPGSQPQAQHKSSNPIITQEIDRHHLGAPISFQHKQNDSETKQSENDSPPCPSTGNQHLVTKPRPVFTQAFPIPILFGGQSGKMWVLGSQTENLSRAQAVSGLLRRLCFLKVLLGAPRDCRLKTHSASAVELTHHRSRLAGRSKER